MDVLLVEPLVSDALAWLQEHYEVGYCPELGDDPVALAAAVRNARALVVPPHVVVSRALLDAAPRLEVVARLQVSTGNTDIDACRQRNIRLVQARSATLRSTAEYILYGLLMLYRRGMISALLGRPITQVPMGRELSGSTIGLLGLSPVAHVLAPMLHGLGVQLLGYDPAVHRANALWERLRVEPVSAQRLLSQSDAVSLQMIFAPRFKGWINERLLNHCKPGQLWVGVSRSALFDTEALALALCDGRIDACLLDGPNPSFAAEGSPLHGLPNLHLTPRLSPHTREAKLRASWYVAQRIHETLSPEAALAQEDMTLLDLMDATDSGGQGDPQALTPSLWGDMTDTPPRR